MGFGLNFLKFTSKRQDPRIRGVYDHLVQQARQPVFYRAYAVADTLSGRFDMIVLHAFLFFQRLKDENENAKAFGQEVFDTFIEDMDRSLREMGVGYQAVPKRVRKMGEAFYGRISAYDQAVEADDPGALRDDLHRNIFPDLDMPPDQAHALEDYVKASIASLRECDLVMLYNADFSFPNPGLFLAMDRSKGKGNV